MGDYLTSDVHLTFEAIERSARFGRFVDSLTPTDRLTIVGDLADFWLCSRQRHRPPGECEGFRSLVDFRSRGGTLVILLGNHDGWMGRSYRHWFDAEVVAEPYLFTTHGRRLHLVHGHRVGARKPWKGWMESKAFLDSFGLLPEPAARLLRQQLDRKNLHDLSATHRRHLDRFIQLAADRADQADLFIFGHVHERFDVPIGERRLIVLGDWFERSPFVLIDERGVRHLDAAESSQLRP